MQRLRLIGDRVTKLRKHKRQIWEILAGELVSGKGPLIGPFTGC